jgi:hypothetical protein
MLASLLNIPHTEDDWEIWSLANYNCLNQIRAAIQAQYNVNLPTYDVQPIPFDDFKTWVSSNQQAHTDFTQILKQQSNDLVDFNFDDERQKENWIWLNYMEIQNACAKLKIGP